MATKDSMSAVSSKLTMTPTGEESVTPVFQLSGLGELSTSMITETNRMWVEIKTSPGMYSTPEDNS